MHFGIQLKGLAVIEKLNQLDHRLFIHLNGGGPESLDGLMRLLSETWIWFPVLAGIIILFIRRDLKTGLVLTGMLLLTLVLTDLISAQVFKDGIQRLRPCYDPALVDQVRLIADQCGGRFGFVSSHASNAFGVITFSLLVLRKPWLTAVGVLWALSVSYSRIHLGVHFPGDIIGGALLGVLIGFLIFAFSKKLKKAILAHEQKD